MIQDYKNYSYRLFWKDRAVAGFSAVTGLGPTASRAFYEYLDEFPRHQPQPGEQLFKTIGLQRGISADHAFYEWANEWFTKPAHDPDNGEEEFDLEELVIELSDETGKTVCAYLLSNARITTSHWLQEPTGVHPVSAFETIEILSEGWALI